MSAHENISSNEQIDYVNDDLQLIQNKNFFKFGTDSLLLSGFVNSKKKYNNAIELGCGSGIISLMLLARNKVKNIDAIEIQPYFCSLAGRNAELNELSDRMTVYCKDVKNIKGSFLSKETEMVVSNPPYMKMTSGRHNKDSELLAARHELYATINDFVSCAAKLIKHGGDFYVVYRQDRLTDLIIAMKNNNFEPKIMTFVHADTLSEPAFVLVKAKYGASGGGLKITKPFYLYASSQNKSGKREYSEEMHFLLKNGYMKFD